MIDYLELKVACKHKQFGESHARIDGGSIVRQWRKWEKVKHPKTNGTTMVRSIKNGDFVVVKGNPAQYFQGHNLFGTSRISDLAVDWICAVLAQLNIEPSAEELKEWRAGKVEVRRVDIAENFLLPSNAVVRAVIREAAFCLMENGRPVSTYRQFSTIYCQQHSRRWALKVYDKGTKPEKPSPAFAKTTLWKTFREYARGQIRVELCLRKPELSRRKLDVLSAWKDLHPKKILKACLSRINLTSSRLIPAPPETARQLKPMEQLVLQVHDDGNDLSYFLHPRTLARYRKRFSALGVILDRKHTPLVDGVTLSDALSERRRIKGVPAWARAAGLFFSPGNRDSDRDDRKMGPTA